MHIVDGKCGAARHAMITVMELTLVSYKFDGINTTVCLLLLLLMILVLLMVVVRCLLLLLYIECIV